MINRFVKIQQYQQTATKTSKIKSECRRIQVLMSAYIVHSLLILYVVTPLNLAFVVYQNDLSCFDLFSLAIGHVLKIRFIVFDVVVVVIVAVTVHHCCEEDVSSIKYIFIIENTYFCYTCVCVSYYGIPGDVTSTDNADVFVLLGL